jgi:hypothetical protein
VVESRSAVDWRDSRFWRTDAERTMEAIVIPFWCVLYARVFRLSAGQPLQIEGNP